MRCPWATREPALTYHDREWGVPTHDDRALFELLILEGAQAGLSWDTILKKRDGYRAAYERFDPDAVARFDAAKIDALAADPRIVRHRGKIVASVANAAAFRGIQHEYGTFAALRRWETGRDAPSARSGSSRQHAAVGRNKPRPPQARVSIRRNDDRLRVSTGVGRRRRPPPRMLPRRGLKGESRGSNPALYARNGNR